MAVLPGVYRISGAPVTRPAEIDVIVERKTSLSAPGIKVHRCQLTNVDRVAVDGIPCTSATRTLLDCAPLVDGETLEAAFERARRMGLTSINAMQKQLKRGRPGSAMMRDVLAHADTRPKESRLEVKLARLLRNSKLPIPTAQFVVGSYRVDYAWLRFRTICECDGFEWHGNRLQWKRDRRRIAAIEAEDWQIVHVTWDDVTKRPAETLERLSLALRLVA